MLELQKRRQPHIGNTVITQCWLQLCLATALHTNRACGTSQTGPSLSTDSKMGPGHMSEGILAEEGVTSSKQSWWQHLPLDQKMQEARGMQELQGEEQNNGKRWWQKDRPKSSVKSKAVTCHQAASPGWGKAETC